VNITRFGSFAAIAVVGTLFLSACAANEGTPATVSTLSGTLVGAGSSAVGAAQESWIADFQMANTAVDITYDPAGSGAGRETFLAGGSDFAGTDRAFNDEEIAAGGFASCAADSGIVQLPLYISPIAIIFNLDGITSLNLDAETIAGIFAGTITSWDDAAIASQNDGVTLPALAITAVHRSDDSGTTDNFTDYLAQAAPSVWTYEADGVWPMASG
jgi:phosphate transport system substrate-binding protein